MEDTWINDAKQKKHDWEHLQNNTCTCVIVCVHMYIFCWKLQNEPHRNWTNRQKKIIINKNKTNRTRRQTWELGSTHLLAFYKSAMLLRMESQSMKMLPWELIIIYVCILWTVCLAHQCLIPLFSCSISKSVTEYDFSFGKLLREGIISLPEKQLLVQLVWLRSLTVKSRRYVAFANESFLHVQRRTWV